MSAQRAALANAAAAAAVLPTVAGVSVLCIVASLSRVATLVRGEGKKKQVSQSLVTQFFIFNR